MSDSSVGGYSLRRGGVHPLSMQLAHGGDWMNPFYTCFPSPAMMAFAPQQDVPNVDYYKGAPVREANKSQAAVQIPSVASVDIETSNPSLSPVCKVKARIPRSNVPTRALRRMDAFASRDWGALPTMSIAPIDAELHTDPIPIPTPIAAARHSLWPPKPTQESWTSRANIPIKAPKALAVGDSSDEGDNSNKDDIDDDKWLMDLQTTVNQAFTDDTSSTTEPQFHFEWSTIGKEIELH